MNCRTKIKTGEEVLLPRKAPEKLLQTMQEVREATGGGGGKPCNEASSFQMVMQYPLGKKGGRGAWGAQSVKRRPSAQVLIPGFWN